MAVLYQRKQNRLYNGRNASLSKTWRNDQQGMYIHCQCLSLINAKKMPINFAASMLALQLATAVRSAPLAWADCWACLSSCRPKPAENVTDNLPPEILLSI
jgi:hypothetical protein